MWRVCEDIFRATLASGSVSFWLSALLKYSIWQKLVKKSYYLIKHRKKRMLKSCTTKIQTTNYINSVLCSHPSVKVNHIWYKAASACLTTSSSDVLSHLINWPFLIAGIEWVDIKHRPAVGIFISMDWSVCTLLLPVAAYFVNDWRYLTITATAPLFLAMLSWW